MQHAEAKWVMPVIEMLFDQYYRIEFLKRLGERFNLYSLQMPSGVPEENPGACEENVHRALALVAGAISRELPADETLVSLFGDEDGTSHISAAAVDSENAGASSGGLGDCIDLVLQRIRSEPGGRAIEFDLESPSSEGGVATLVRTATAVPINILGHQGGFIAVLQDLAEGPAAPASIRLEVLAILMGSVLEELANEVTNEDRLRSLARGLSAALDARDPRTKGHSDRVAMYAMAVVNEIIGGGEVQSHQNLRSSVRLGALLHDIGKIGIPDCILLKPSSLTSEEYDAIKHHPILGAEIVNACHGFEDLVPAVLYHHERCDGKGYPFGLDRSRLPLIARIIGLADAFDAITSDRPFRKASSHDEAIGMLRPCVPDMYDQELFDALVRAHEKGVLKEIRLPSKSSRVQETPERDIEKFYGTHLKSVPSLPPVLSTISSLVDDPNASLKEIAKILSTDEGLASRALKLVNSAYYGLPQMISTIPLAATILGARAIRNYVVNIAMSDLMNVLGGSHKEYGLLWTHALKAALWAKVTAKKLGTADCEEAFTAGLVHDIGMALSLRLKPDDYGKLIVEADRTGRALMSVETQIMGFNHTEMGAWAARKWMLPDPLINSIRWHHSPDDMAWECNEIANLVRVIHVADVLARYKKADDPLFSLGRDNVSPGSADKLGPQVLAELEAMRDDVDAQEQALRDTFGHMRTGQ